jgi:hypothetical protein
VNTICRLTGIGSRPSRTRQVVQADQIDELSDFLLDGGEANHGIEPRQQGVDIGDNSRAFSGYVVGGDLLHRRLTESRCGGDPSRLLFDDLLERLAHGACIAELLTAVAVHIADHLAELRLRVASRGQLVQI